MTRITEQEVVLDFAVAKVERATRLMRNSNLYYDSVTEDPGRVLVGDHVEVYVERTPDTYRVSVTYRGDTDSMTTEWIELGTVEALVSYLRGELRELRSMATTQELPAMPTPRAVPARRVDESTAHPAWRQAMESLRKTFCAAVLVCGLAGAARADGPSIALDPPAWAFVVDADREPSLPVDSFLAELDSAVVEGAIERVQALTEVGPFEPSDPFDGRGEQVSATVVQAMIEEGSK
jgi:hypothetical protein